MAPAGVRGRLYAYVIQQASGLQWDPDKIKMRMTVGLNRHFNFSLNCVDIVLSLLVSICPIYLWLCRFSLGFLSVVARQSANNAKGGKIASEATYSLTMSTCDRLVVPDSSLRHAISDVESDVLRMCFQFWLRRKSVVTVVQQGCTDAPECVVR